MPFLIAMRTAGKKLEADSTFINVDTGKQFNNKQNE